MCGPRAAIHRRRRKQDLLATFGDWPEGIAEVIEATPEEQIYRGDVYHRIPLSSAGGRALRRCSATRPTRTMPAFGQGAGMAIEDAAVLSGELSAVGDLSDSRRARRGARRYEQQRIPRTSAIVNRARRMSKLCTLEERARARATRSDAPGGAGEHVAAHLRARAHLSAVTADM